MGLAGLIFFYIGVSMGWLYTFMGVVLGSGVVPIALCITWKKANKWGCLAGAVVGFFSGLIAWLVTTSTLNGGVINVTTTGGDFEMLAGNLASIGVGGIISTVTSYIWPDNFDFAITREINAPRVHVSEHGKRDSSPDEADIEEKDVKRDATTDVEIVDDDEPVVQPDPDLDPAGLEKAYSFASWSSLILTLVLLILIPLPLFGAQTIFGVGGLTAWVVIGILWCFCSAFAVVLYPLWESRVAIRSITSGIIKDMASPGSGKYVAPEIIRA